MNFITFSLADRLLQRMRRFYFASALLLSILGLVSGKYVSGSISNGVDWSLVSQFSFIDDKGQLDYKVEYSVTDQCCPNLAYYFHDVFESVSSNNDMDCQSKLSFAEGVVTFQNTENSGNLSTQCITSSATKLRKCSGVLRLQSIQDRLWFFVLSHCNSTKGLDVSYEFTFTNGDSWEMHLSAEEMHILEIQAIPFGGLLVVFVAALYIARQLLQQDKLHRVYRLFMLSLTCEVFGQSLDYIYYMYYVKNGVQLRSLQTIAELLHATSEVTFVILLILLSNGWTISTAHLGHKKQMRLTAFLSLYILTYGILFVCKKEFFDPDASHFPFESHVDKAYRSLKLVAWACFVHGAFLSIRNHPAKKTFYLKFMTLYSAWFLFLPLNFLAYFILFDEWYNLGVLRILRMLPYLCVLGFAVILFIMHPRKGYVNFSIHVNGNEVDPAQVEEPFTFQNAEAFMDQGNKANQANMGTFRESDDKGRLGFRF